MNDLPSYSGGVKREPISEGTHEAIVAEVVYEGEQTYQGSTSHQCSLVIQVAEEDPEWGRKELRYFFKALKLAKNKQTGEMYLRPVTGVSANGSPSAFRRAYEGILGKPGGKGIYWYNMKVPQLKKDFEGQTFTLKIVHDQAKLDKGSSYPEKIVAFGPSADPITLEGYTPVDERGQGKNDLGMDFDDEV